MSVLRDAQNANFKEPWVKARLLPIEEAQGPILQSYHVPGSKIKVAED
jgi:hypothetical protein